MKKLLLSGLLSAVGLTYGQSHSHSGAQPMVYPDIPGYVSMKVDLHEHTVFSDGKVWPSIRVMEALREDLDAISLTEHLEYQPHIEDIPHPDRNRSYQLAMEEAKDHDLLIVHGSEITRDAPMGHNNAVFITDANALMAKDSLTAFQEAKKHGAFILWNHPAWYSQNPHGNPVMSQFQKDRVKNGELHGIEVINSVDFAQESLALALEYNLTIMGTSDIHGLIDWDYTEKGIHRPITLAFTEEKSIEGLKKALFAGRTVAVYNGLLVGREEYLKPLLKACIKINNASYIPKTQILKVELENTSSSNLLFENQMPYSFYSSSPIFEVKAGDTYTLQIKTLEEKPSVTLALKALGAFTAPRVQPVIEWEVKVE